MQIENEYDENLSGICRCGLEFPDAIQIDRKAKAHDRLVFECPYCERRWHVQAVSFTEFF